MKIEAAEIQPAVDLERIAREARKLNVEISDGEKLLERTEEKLSDRRERLGRLLIEARSGFSKRGDGFVEWTEREIGIAFATAQRYMTACGYTPPKEPGAGRPRNHNHTDYDSTQQATEPATVSSERPSAIEGLIRRGVSPRDAVAQVSSNSAIEWIDEVERLAQNMHRAARSLAASAEALDVLCRQHEASVSSPTALTVRTMLVAAEGSIQKTLQLMGGKRT